MSKRISPNASTPPSKRSQLKPTITITFGEQVENHAGMEKVGSMASEGFSVEELQTAMKKLQGESVTCEMINLNEALESVDISERASSASVLLIRGGVSFFGGSDDATDELLEEQSALKWDTKAKMYGRVVSKKARHNLCYADFAQSPDYENGQGTIISFENVPLLQKIRVGLENYLGTKAQTKKILAEGNLYYDPEKCGIALRLGITMPLHYQWFFQGNPVGKRMILSLQHGDMYVMSEKATGFDWKKKIIPTLRHAAGSEKFTTIKEKKKKKSKKESKKKKRRECHKF